MKLTEKGQKRSALVMVIQDAVMKAVELDMDKFDLLDLLDEQWELLELIER